MKRLILILLVLSFIFVLAGCAKLTERASEKLIEGMLEKSAVSEDGVEIDINDDRLSIETENGESMVWDYSGKLDWPQDLPDLIPELKANFTSVASTNDGWMLTCEGASKDDYENYIEELKQAGMEKEFESSLEETSKSIYGSIGDMYIVLTFESDGYMSLTITKK